MLTNATIVERDYAKALHHKNAYHRRKADAARAEVLASWQAGEIDERDYWRIMDAIADEHCVQVPVHRAVDSGVLRKEREAAQRRADGRWAGDSHAPG